MRALLQAYQGAASGLGLALPLLPELLGLRRRGLQRARVPGADCPSRPGACCAAGPSGRTGSTWCRCLSTQATRRPGRGDRDDQPAVRLLAGELLFKDIGKIFHPLFEFFGLILSAIYSVTNNYGLSIIGLTVLIMLALTPVTIKSTKSMIAMQRLQPEMKKLQAKYKGPENRELLNQEMMKLYKENGTSPFGACLPPLLQMPFLIVLYSLIRGLVQHA